MEALPEKTLNTQLLTIRELEDTLKLGHTKTYELINAGEIQTLKIGRRRLAVQKSVENFISRMIKDVRETGGGDQ